MEALVDAVALTPHQADVAGAMAQGLSEDAVFEIVVSAAVGAGYAKVAKALNLIEETKP